MPIDSYKFLPKSFRAGYESTPMQESEAVWAPLGKPASEATVALITSAGIYLKAGQEPFDVEREKREPTWGDPTYRVIPRGTLQAEIDATHLHINTRDVKEDLNVALPIRAFATLEADGAIGALAQQHYSFMGFQQAGADEWRSHYGPEVAERCKQAAVDAVVLAPA